MQAGKIVILLIGFLISTPLRAQIPESYRPVVNQEALKNKIRHSSDVLQSITSDFTQQKHLTMMDEVLISNGRFLFRKPNHVKWEYSEPIHYTILIRDEQFTINNDGKISQYNTESNKLFREVNRMIVMAIQGNFVDNPDFDAEFFENDKTYLAKLKTRDPLLGEMIQQILIEFDKTDLLVSEVKFIEPGDDFTVISMSNPKTNIELADELFSFE